MYTCFPAKPQRTARDDAGRFEHAASRHQEGHGTPVHWGMGVVALLRFWVGRALSMRACTDARVHPPAPRADHQPRAAAEKREPCHAQTARQEAHCGRPGCGASPFPPARVICHMARARCTRVQAGRGRRGPGSNVPHTPLCVRGPDSRMCALIAAPGHGGANDRFCMDAG